MTFEELDTELSSGFAPFMISLSEGEDNELSVTISPSEVGERRDFSEKDEPNPAIRELLSSSRPILPNENKAFTITFEGYILYQVGNESYCSGDPRDKFTGKFLRVYESSALLERIGELSDAQILKDGTFYPGKWAHYEIVTQNHIISVISLNEPKVSIIAEK
ncbi:MAG: hypothetical protein K2J77_03195 [Oscillospiraceae bacterium]|nr:hypothetical protein [Oscillospiraceae bacterium]